ncbi:RidA family protein [Solitalea koreensis]|uniref:Reactive intermediate/imine deaminase n=1 Tax=Solitalea koreensis TaxID=543615 RepID=A0A521D4J8_9SPHI|nr:Rid family detoxifying hydrolase [Solitalea koreensis]SMO65810.1 reactive intermediate/imine deaminase [Solitalea koreensis]
MNIIHTNKVADPAGHYSQGVRMNGFIFVSGQLPVGYPVETPLDEQVTIVLQQMKDIVEAGGSSLEQVVKTTLYISDVNDWPAVNAAYAKFFGEHKPARSIVPVPALHYGYKIEVEAIASF